jgi:hypothetical protein
MTALNDLTGKKFGRLTVICRDEAAQNELKNRGKRPRVMWLCQCDCGNNHTANSSHLLMGRTSSCGCYAKEVIGSLNASHRMTKTKEYNAWLGMKARCENEKTDSYLNYGARGIKVCARWKKFDRFYADLGRAPSPMHSIDRIDPNGDYSPENCRWATVDQQANNKTSNIFIEYKGKKQTILQWSRELGINEATIRARFHRGLSAAETLSTQYLIKHGPNTGVTVCKSNGKYLASISVKGKTIHLGRFANKEDAIKARIDAEIKYRGSPDSDRVSAVYTAHQ